MNNGPRHLALARRQLSRSYQEDDIRLRELYVQQSQAHSLIALVCAVAEVGQLQPSMGQHVRKAMQLANGEQCSARTGHAQCTLPPHAEGDHEHDGTYGYVTWPHDDQAPAATRTDINVSSINVPIPADEMPFTRPYLSAEPTAPARGMC